MDPNACLQSALRFLTSDDITDRGEAIARLQTLTTWLENGGFPPSVHLKDRGYGEDDNGRTYATYTFKIGGK